MKNERTTATLVGVLYIIGTGAGVASAVVSGGLPGAAGTTDAGSATVTALLVLVMGLALAIIPALMFPILKRESETLAVGYVIFRSALETGFHIATAMSWLVLPVIVGQAATAGGTTASQYSALETLVLKVQSPMGAGASIVFAIGGLMLYYAMYRLRLVPRWLSGWGLIGCAPYMAAGVIGLFGSAPGLLFVPIAVQEMVMAVWLIVRGFSSSAVQSARGLHPIAA